MCDFILGLPTNSFFLRRTANGMGVNAANVYLIWDASNHPRKAICTSVRHSERDRQSAPITICNANLHLTHRQQLKTFFKVYMMFHSLQDRRG